MSARCATPRTSKARNSSSRSSSSTRSATTWSSRAARSWKRRTAPSASAAGEPAGRPVAQGRGQEPHRLRRLRRPRRRRRPAAHHRHGLEAHQASVGDRRESARRSWSRCSSSTASATASPWAQAAGRRSLGQHHQAATPRAPRLGQGHQPHRLRLLRRDRRGRRGSGARLRDGLDQQERASVQGRQLGDEVEVMVLDIDEERRRISLGIKQCQRTPGTPSPPTTSKGDRISGQIKSITDFGIFIGLDGGIDGLVHLSDISWNETGEEAVRATRRATRSRPSCCRSIRSASASPSASSSSRTIRSATTSRQRSRQHRHRHDHRGRCQGRDVEAGDGRGLPQGVRDLPRSRRRRAQRAAQGRRGGRGQVRLVDRKNRTISLSIKAKDMADEQEIIS
jgi:hypothetical protein